MEKIIYICEKCKRAKATHHYEEGITFLKRHLCEPCKRAVDNEWAKFWADFEKPFSG